MPQNGLSKEELLAKCDTSEPITRQDMGMVEAGDKQYGIFKGKQGLLRNEILEFFSRF